MDVADEDGVILEVIAEALNVSRERIRQIEARILLNLGMEQKDLAPDGHDFEKHAKHIKLELKKQRLRYNEQQRICQSNKRKRDRQAASEFAEGT